MFAVVLILAEDCSLCVCECRKMWQKLGDMSAEEAQREYIRVVEDVLPQWQSPPSWDGALLVSYTPSHRKLYEFYQD